MHTIELTEEELTLVRAALHSYLDDFGHEEADVLRSSRSSSPSCPPPTLSGDSRDESRSGRP